MKQLDLFGADNTALEASAVDALRLTNDLAWNEAEELHCSLSTLSFAEIEECHDSLVARAEKIMKLLGENDDETN